MSDTNKVESKMDTLFNKVYLPVFINKLAECGVAVGSEEELYDMLKIAALTRAHIAAEAPTPQASVIKQAADRLEALTRGNADIIDTILQDPEVAGVFQAK